MHHPRSRESCPSSLRLRNPASVWGREQPSLPQRLVSNPVPGPLVALQLPSSPSTCKRGQVILSPSCVWGGVSTGQRHALAPGRARAKGKGKGKWVLPLWSWLPSFPAATSVDKGECLGGATLSLLHDRSFSYTGDSQAQELCLYLTKAASVPYFEILEKWIYRGIINDPYRSALLPLP